MGVARYALWRLVQAVPVLLGVVTITFLLANAIPGDPIQTMLGPSPSQAQVESIRAKYGLDRPLWKRYVTYLADVARGDLGRSIYFEAPVRAKIAERFPKTMLLMLSSYLFAVVVAVPLGVLSAKRRNEPADHAARVASLIGVSTPSFWIGLVLILLFVFELGWFPSTDLVLPWADPAGVAGASTRVDVLGTALSHLVLPVVALGTLQMAAITRIERSEMLDVLSQDYVTLARAYGVRERTILRKHAFRNAQLPVITIVGLQLASAIGGAILIEAVFSINGMGTLILTAIYNLDYPLITGTTLVFSLFFLVGVILTDIAYAYVDPRVSYGAKEV
jgi:peptide/nickel transport system permease protein